MLGLTDRIEHRQDGTSFATLFRQPDRDLRRTTPLIFCYKNSAAVIDRRFKLIYTAGQYELYDIAADPEERYDLSARHPARARRMASALHRALDSYRRSFEGEEYGSAPLQRVPQPWHDVTAHCKR